MLIGIMIFQITDVIKGNDLKHHFNSPMEEGVKVYMQQQKIGLFKTCAFLDFQAFWAESLELFFERPQALYTHYPDLYEDMVQLLQQDPRFPFHPLVG
jgi:Mlc titration factor MtfA (ptsG expression regulator)